MSHEALLMHDRVISRLRRRLGVMLALRHVLLLLTLWAFLWGTVTLATRVAWHGMPEWLVWGLWVAPILLGVGVYLGLRQLPGRPAVRALVDRASACGGLLMASEEQSLGPWENRLPDAADLRIRWNGRRALGMFATAALFLAVAFFFPQRLATWANPALDVGDDVQRLISKIDLLKDEKILDPKRAEFLQQKLEQVRDEAEGRNPAKTLEALDHVRDQIMKAAKQAAESAVKKTEKLGLAEGLAEGLRKNDGQLDSKLEKEAVAELNSLVQKALQENGALLDEKLLDPELLKQLKEGKLSAEDLKKIAEALKGCKECLAGSLEKLQKARLIDAEMLKKLAEAGKCYCPAKDGDPALCLAEILARGKTNSDRGGKGGVTEGPGHNPITWTDGTNEDNLKFKEIVLPPSDLKQSRILGIGKVDPKTGEVTASKAGALNKDNAGGGGANTGVVLPQHRSTIERFFLRSQKKE